jgi:two-component system, LytTR family, sensor histidine kinase AlgZ
VASQEPAPVAEWYGLWHPSPPRRWHVEQITRIAIYLVTPLALALLFGATRSSLRFGLVYASSFIVGVCVAGSFELLYHLVWPRLIHRQPSWPARLVGHLATLAVAVVGGGTAAAHLGGVLLGWDDVDLPRLWLQAAVISSIIVGVLIALDELHARTRELERREAAARVAALRAELAALQARTDPHFLFNSLNTVAALIPADPVLAESLLERLATVFRYALDAGRRDTVALADELAAVEAYLGIEQLRLGDRLRWRLDRGAAIEALRVPPLVLQPLVENAIRHGAGGRRAPTAIVVTARVDGGELVLAVEDHPTDGTTAAAPITGGAGVALRELAERLAITYGGRARITAGAAAPAGWRAEVTLPAEAAPT